MWRVHQHHPEREEGHLLRNADRRRPEDCRENGEVCILSEGRVDKFVEQVEQITFSGEYAQSINQTVLCVTERAVFELTADGVVLTEIAPGIDLETDVLAHMGFKPIISNELRTMDAKIFGAGPMHG